MAKDTNTARRPNTHYYGRDLREEGFFDTLIAHGSDAMILGIYEPEEYLRARVKHMDGEITDDELRKVIEKHPPDLTWRMDDEERTLCGSYDYSHTCPPDCS